MGPEAVPPSDRLVYSLPSARAAGSVHCTCGEVNCRLIPRVRKLEPDWEPMLKLAPLKPPRDGSMGEVASEVETAASRGRFPAPTCMPLSVTLFWSPPSPST